jgi:hypothetical protein
MIGGSNICSRNVPWFGVHFSNGFSGMLASVADPSAAIDCPVICYASPIAGYFPRTFKLRFTLRIKALLDHRACLLIIPMILAG